MTCNPLYNLPVRCIFIEVQETILDNYNIPDNERRQINGIWYLVLRVDSENYTRIEEGNRSDYITTRGSDFISPQLLKVGLNIKMINQRWNVFQCLSFVATSSLSTQYSGTYIPNTLIDTVRPEFTDVASTIRVGRLQVIATGGTNGNDSNTGAPLYIESYDLNFKELSRRLIA